MKIAELQALVREMTPGMWKAYVHGSMGTSDFTIDGPNIMLSYCDRNDALGIAALRNHAEALLDLVSVCETITDAAEDGISYGEMLLIVSRLHGALHKIERIQ